MKTSIKNIIFGVILALFYHISHEWTHYRIFEYYKCEEITAGLMSVSASGCLEGVLSVNTLNDIIGYTVVPALFLIAYFLGKD